MAKELSAKLVTITEAFGYRDADLILDVREETGTVRRMRVRIEPGDARRIVEHLRQMHRHAWDQPQGPIDRRPGEIRPAWIDERDAH